jgi:hypothetical protein
VWLERPQLRRQFLIAFILCWALIGNLAATLMASVGPCFYDFFYGEGPYAGLMTYLRQADQVYPLAALTVQDSLLQTVGTARPLSRPRFGSLIAPE